MSSMRFLSVVMWCLSGWLWSGLPIVAQPMPVLASEAIQANLTPAAWEDLPGFYDDNLQEVLPAWLASCALAKGLWTLPCNELKTLQKADPAVLRFWLHTRLQPMRVQGEGVLTGYYEPVFQASRLPTQTHRYPLYRLPVGAGKQPWYSRQEMDTHPAAVQALQGQAIAHVSDPLDALALQIQGSGQLDVAGEGRIRLAFAGTNQHPYKSIGAWLQSTHGVRELTWPAIKAWAEKHPDQLQPLLWSNPRVVFFKEEAATPEGPKGAQGIPLTAGRSIAVDAGIIPYGTPVWLSSQGDSVSLSRLVVAQDTGAAIRGAVRADYFVGTGPQAGDVAGRLKQPLKMWVLLPK